jgi:hypothetical protein
MKSFGVPSLNSQLNKLNSITAVSCLLIVLIAGAGRASAADLDTAAACSSTASAAVAPAPAVNIGPIPWFQIYNNAQYESAGVGLRNRRTGAIEMSGVIAPVQAAWIYWAVITQGPPPAAASQIQVQRLAPPAPASANVTLAGVTVGNGPQPCEWNGNRITVFRALIPAAVATGNGTYKITRLAGGGGLVGGENPWAAPQVLPLWEGASIVMVGTGTQTVALYDFFLSGNTFNADNGLAYQLILPFAIPANTEVFFDEIGADGQHGMGRIADPAVSAETTMVQGIPVAGPGSDYNDSDWNGNAGLVLPELWDDAGHRLVVPNATAVLNVGITNGPAFGFGDCITPVANVVALP